MRVLDAAGEAVRNVVSGVSHAVLLLFVISAATAGALQLDLSVISATLTRADTFRATGGSTWVISLDEGIDALRCDRLASTGGVVAAGALRTEPVGTRLTVLPSLSIDTLTATPGFGALIGAQRTADRVWLSERLSQDLGLRAPGWASTHDGQVFISDSFPYPSDGRNPILEYSRVNFSESQLVYDACWLSLWPASPELASALRSAPLRDGVSATDVQVAQLNSTLGTTIDPASEFTRRPTSAAGAAAGLVAGLLTLVVGYLRRLEYASARHVGVTRLAATLIALFEALVWMIPLALVLIATVAAMVSRSSPAHSSALWEAGLRIGVQALAGALLGALAMPFLVSERRLFAYFRSRS